MIAIGGFAQTNAVTPLPITLNLGLNGLNPLPDVDVGIKILFAITLLSLAPRAKRERPLMRGSNGGEVHNSNGSAGCTS